MFCAGYDDGVIDACQVKEAAYNKTEDSARSAFFYWYPCFYTYTLGHKLTTQII